MPKVTFIIDGEPTVIEFEHGKLPYSNHGKPESFLDVAKNHGVPLEHACGGSCACTTCHVIIREGAQQPHRDAGRRGRSARHRVGPHHRLAARVPGGDHRRRGLRVPDATRNYVQEGGGIQLGKSDRKKEEVAR